MSTPIRLKSIWRLGRGERQIIAADVLCPGIRARHDPSKLGLLLAALL